MLPPLINERIKFFFSQKNTEELQSHYIKKELSTLSTHAANYTFINITFAPIKLE